MWKGFLVIEDVIRSFDENQVAGCAMVATVMAASQATCLAELWAVTRSEATQKEWQVFLSPTSRIKATACFCVGAASPAK